MSCSSSITCGTWGGDGGGVCICLSFTGPALCFSYVGKLYWRADGGGVSDSGPLEASASLSNGKILVCFGALPPDNYGEFRWELTATFCGTEIGTCNSSYVCYNLGPPPITSCPT